MRVAQINSVAGFGCTGLLALNLLEKLNESGNECRLFYGRGISGDTGCTVRFALKPEVMLHGIQTRLLGSHASGSPVSTCRLLNMLDDFQPDVIHLHNAHGYYLNLYSLLNYISEKNVPFVWTFHDAWPFTGHCAYFYDCEGWLKGCGDCPRKSDYPRSFIFDRSAGQWRRKLFEVRKLKRFIAVTPSKWLADLAGRSFYSGKEIRTVYNGIDTDSIFVPSDGMETRRKYGIPENKYLFVTVAGGLSCERKGGHHLAWLTRRFESMPVHFAVAGWKEGTDSLPQNLTALPVIRSPKEMARFYSMADAFLLLSEVDNFPTVGIEALSCGTPIIGFAAGGAPEQIDEYTGKMVAVGDMSGLESLINRFISETGMFSKKLCRARAVKLFSKQAMYEGYMACYKDVIGSERNT